MKKSRSDLCNSLRNWQKHIDAHVAGEVALQMALEAGVDVLHRAHGITDLLIEKAAEQQVEIVATPMGGTLLQPNSPEEILKLMSKNIAISISTDAYLPPYQGIPWLPRVFREMQQLKL